MLVHQGTPNIVSPVVFLSNAAHLTPSFPLLFLLGPGAQNSRLSPSLLVSLQYSFL